MQLPDGSMPAGHNGPYHDTDTPVRNTGHWLITFLKAHEISGDVVFMEAATRAAQYLSSKAARPMGATFYHRTNPDNDFCNGLVGQAWTIEALAIASHELQDDSYRELAESVFLLHPFDEKVGLWRRVGVDGSWLSYDFTFNHQLWFAAAGSMLLPSGDQRIKSSLARFMDLLPQTLIVYPNGLIYHPLRRPIVPSRLGRVRKLVRSALAFRADKTPQRRMYNKSIGYHAFNLYAFAMLYQHTPDHVFWQSQQFLSTLRYLDDDEFLNGINDNEFGYPYNPPGFEVAYALSVFGKDDAKTVERQMSDWVSSQLTRCFDFESGQMSLNTEDPITHAARIYEATRLPELSLEVTQ